MKLDLSPESWGRVILSTVLGTSICVAAAVYVDSFNFANMDDAGRVRALLTDVVLPIVLAVPMFLFFTGKLRELAIAHRHLTIYASTDGLTQVMNRAAFSTLVDAYLKDVHASAGRAGGALLIIDADNFKAVNDRYGHDRGDEALIAIAAAIKAMLRAPDIVGRLGGEEFGVVLPDCGMDSGIERAESIRRAVAALSDREDPGIPVSASFGVACTDESGYDLRQLLMDADHALYRAKRAGRNCVVAGKQGEGVVVA